MLCAAYTDPRLTAVYDTLNPPGADDAFYLGIAGSERKAVLDIGCGSGRLATALAARGHDVTGADPAAAMLDVARRRAHAGTVRWIEADAAGLDLPERFDLAFMTGHVFQVFLTDADVLAALRTAHRHLKPGGRLALEMRNVFAREWESWVPVQTTERLDVPGIGEVQVFYDISKVEGRLVTFETHFRFGADDTALAATTLRFMEQSEVARFLAEAGFGEVEWFGDYDGSRFVPSSPEILAVATL
ncbi:MAG: class I SAM-dependent methyltransferase [Rhizobiaceae bacterium]